MIGYILIAVLTFIVFYVTFKHVQERIQKLPIAQKLNMKWPPVFGALETALYEFQKKNRVNLRRSQTDKNCDGCSVNHRMIHINQRISKNQT